MYDISRRLLGGLIFHIDANIINARQKHQAVNRLEQWRRDGVIDLTISQRAQEEAAAGRDARRTSKAMAQPAWLPLATSDEEKELWREIGNVVFPHGAPSERERQRQRNDIEILFSAWKYLAILVTNDGGSKRQPGGILGNRYALNKLGVRVMTPEEGVRHVVEQIRHRDRNAVQFWKATGKREPLPFWLSEDAAEIRDEIRRYRDS